MAVAPHHPPRGIENPAVAPGDLALVIDHLVHAGSALAHVKLDERIAVIDRVAAEWLTDDSPWRRLALERVPAATGYPPAAVRLALDHLWGALRAPSLRAVAHAEGVAECDGGGQPRLAVHVLAGNVPGVGVFAMIAGLLAGVPGLVKTARREPLLAPLVTRSLASADTRLGAALAVVHWPGGSTAHERTALAGADLVLAYGRTESLDAVAAYRPRRLLRFGPRLSVAVVAREAADPATAADAALQAALFDQQGCLSPQLVVVEEPAPGAAEHFAAALADELARLAVTLPAAPLALAESAAVWRFVARQRWRAQEGAAVRVHADPEGRFSVVSDRSGALPASPLNRHVVVAPVASLAAARAPLRRLAGLVEAVGYAGPARRADEAATLAVECGAHRLCPLARMQAPPFAWKQGGYARLASFRDRECGAQ